MINKPQKITVSIIMATYNRAHLIEETLDSILNQSYENFECLIIDDGSTDNTLEVISVFIKEDQRFRYLRRTEKYKKGLPGCRNYGLDLSNRKYVVFFDDDDIPHPDLLLLTLNEIEKCNVNYCRYLRNVFSNNFNQEFDRSEDYTVTNLQNMSVEKMIVGEIPFNSCQILWDSSCFSNLRFNEELMFAEEWELYTRILLSGKTGISLEKVLYFGRKHTNSNTGEFWNDDPVRVTSKIKAIKLVIDNLKKNKLLTEKLVKYFIRWGFQFKKPEIINYTLKQSDTGIFKSVTYKVGYVFYPLLRPLLKVKGKLMKNKE